MSEFLAEAQVLIVPNTAAFAASLKTQLEAAVAAAGPVLVPVAAVGGIAPAETAAIRQQAAGMHLLGAEAQVAASATTSLTRAQTLGVAAAQKLALAQAQVEGSASAAAAAQVSFTRSTAAVAVAEDALAAALRAKNIAIIDAASNSLRLAEAHHAEALGALEAARAEAIHNAALSQTRRAFLAQAAAGAGLRGAVLASTAAFIAATVAAVAVGKSVKAASDLNEEINKTNEVFGESAKTILNWSKTTGHSFGIARVEALKSIGTFGELFRTLGVGTPEAAKLSERLVELSADLASFFNAVPEDALRALQSGLIGQARPLRQFGIFLTEARVKQEALRESGKKSAEALTQQEKILARYNLILQDSKIASGDFARTQDQLANQSRILRANIEDVGGMLGKVLLPGILFTIEGLNDLIDEAKATGKAIGDLAGFVEESSPVQFVIEIIKKFPGGEKDGESFFSGLKAELEVGVGAALIATGVASSELGVGFAIAGAGSVVLAKGLADLHGETNKLKPDVSNLDAAFGKLTLTMNKFGTAFEAAVRAVANAQITKGLEGLEEKQLEIQTGIASGGQSAEAENLRRQVELDKAKVAASGKNTEARKQALRDLKADQDTLAALMAKDASNAKAIAADMERSSNEAQAARDRQFQALADLFSGRQQRNSNAQTRAALTPGLQDDIALNKQLIAALKKEMSVLLARLKTLKVSLGLRNSILAAISKAIFDAQTQAIRLRQQAKQAAEDEASEKLDLRIQLADATGNVKAQIAAHRAKLAAITAELVKLRRQHKKNTVEYLRLKVAQAEEEAAINDLKGQTEKNNNAAQELIFAFLQAQQGFAANLIGNLIPGGATGGLVGGGGAAGPAAGTVGRDVTGERGGVQGAPTPDRGIQGESAKAEARERGVSSGQGSTQISLLRDIKRLLVLLNSRAGHPEAKHQKTTSNATMDGVGGSGGGTGGG